MTLGKWLVGTRFTRPTDLSGGYFSEGYAVTDGDGNKAFLKAFDLEAIFRMTAGTGISRMDALNIMTTGFQFERKLLDYCSGMDRVCRVLDGGEAFVESENPFSLVPYLVLEIADGDIRMHLRDVRNIETSWRLRSLHHVATGLLQLHSADVAHQDLKPSNVLVFGKSVSKIGDLGRSSTKFEPSMNDSAPFAGSKMYSPPETLYAHLDPDWSLRRVPCDLFLFGSIIVFLFTQLSMSSMMLNEFLAHEHRPQPVWKGAWTGTFIEVLPYLHHSFALSLEEFRRNLPEPRYPRHDYRAPLTDLVARMCNPDPSQRGMRLPSGERSLSLERVVSLLNNLALRS